MLRTIMASVALAVFCLGGATAGGKKEGEEKKGEKERPKGKRVIGTFIRADTEAEPDTITFKTKDGEKTLKVAKTARFWGEDRKPESLQDLVAHMKKEKEDERHIIIFENDAGTEILAVGDLPEKGDFTKKGFGGKFRPVFAVFISVDQTKTPATITFRTKGEKEQTLPLAEKAKFYGEDRKPESLDELVKDMKNEPEKERRIIIFEDEARTHIVAIGDLPEKGDFPKKQKKDD